MESNYSSQYSGEQVDAAVEYFLRHSQIEEGSYDYTSTVFCESSVAPAVPFNTSSLPTPMPKVFPFAGTDGNLWYDVPNTSSKDWYQCVLKINSDSGKVVSQGSIIKLSGDKGDGGSSGGDGSDGKDGQDGNDGEDGNFTEFRYKRSSQYAIYLTDTQKQSRYPEGWSTNWDTVDVESYTELKSSIEYRFDVYLCSFVTSTSAIIDTTYFTSLSSNPTFAQISSTFSNNHQGASLSITDEQQAIIVECYKKFRAIYNRCSSPSNTETPLACNTDYHKVWTDYVDIDHFWVLFQINAVIAADGSVVREWSDPQRIQGVDGKPGPKGSNGIDGIPGVNIGIAFALGTETTYNAVNPTSSSYVNNYLGLFQAGTRWYRETPSVTTDYPYIWVTQCRYKVNQDSNGNDIYTMEDSWSTPRRYTGLNGVTTHETVYTRNPIIYPAGIFTLNTTYANDGKRAPYVYYDGCYYYLSAQGTFTSDRESSNPKTATTYWTLMEHFEALFAEVGIIANGLVGSAVFNGDYMFSQQGLDYNGAFSTHYEGFLTHYSTGDQLTNPYDANADFTPNICINFKTGQLWSRTISNEISEASANISLTVQENINGQLKQAGIEITSSGVHVTGQFSGTMDGTFNGKVSAKSLEVLNDAGTPVIVFDTYKEAMGTPSGGTAPEVGTPVLLVNHKGAQYLVSMVKLVTGGASGTYRQTNPVIDDLYTTTSPTNSTIGTQGSANYHIITKAPYLTLLNSDGTATSNVITADLYDSAGAKVNWSSYLNRYYSGTLVEEYPEKTDLGAGVWAFKVVGSFANVTNIYNGKPTTKIVAAYGEVTVNSTDSQGRPDSSRRPVYYNETAYVYSKISINNGILTKLDTHRAICQYSYPSEGQRKTGSGYRYLATMTATAYYLYGSSSSPVQSNYFMKQYTTAQEVTTQELTQSAAIVILNQNQ